MYLKQEQVHMGIKKIQKSDWQNYFDRFSKNFLKDEQPEYAEIQILSKDSGAQPETQWLPLEGITYDKKSDLINIKVENLDRMILHPLEVYVDEDESENGWITSIEIVEQNGNKDIIEIR